MTCLSSSTSSRISVTSSNLIRESQLNCLDSQSVQLLGKSTSVLKEDIEQRCVVGDFPVEFEALVDKEILFKVEVRIENVKKNGGPYTILQLAEDATLISKYKNATRLLRNQTFILRCPRLTWIVEKIRLLVMKFLLL